MIKLRPFQDDLKNDLYSSWDSGSRATICVLPTGGGKTVIMAKVADDVNEPMCLIAHRQELVQQISIALARMGLKHRIIAPQKVISVIISTHIFELGQSYYDANAHLAVAGINTLLSRAKDLTQWCNTVRFWAGDECHHFLANNQWGKGVQLFPNAIGVGFTATPIRCDRKSLHVEQGGVFSDMCVGPCGRELIDMGYLSDYRIFGPPQSIDRSLIKISNATGDFSSPSLRAVAEQSTITGDIVQHYMRFAEGKRGITFTVDVKSAVRTAELYREAGIPAEAVSAKTPDTVRNETIRKFQRGSILQLVNVDLFGEGFDVPAVECVSMGRPSQSKGLVYQQFGRALRTFEGKEDGIIIDHVGNMKQHGLPDVPHRWSLFAENTGRRRMDDGCEIPVTTCLSCFRAYEAVTKSCPFCGHETEPESRSEPKFVDGDLVEFSPELLAELRQKAMAVQSDFVPVPENLRGTPAEGRLHRLRGEHQIAIGNLQEAITYWAGIRRDREMDNSEIYRRFYHIFKIDIASAQSLPKKDAEDLTARIKERYWE